MSRQGKPSRWFVGRLGRGPKKIEDDKWLVWGRGRGGRLSQVVFVVDEDNDDTAFVLHARPLTEKEKRQFRRRSAR